VRAAAVVFSLILSSSSLAQQAVDHPHHLRLILPTGVLPEAVRINHFMTGPFGGAGGYGVLKQDQIVYELALAYEGRQATAIKGFVYMPGCEFFTWDAALQPDSDLELKPGCKPQPIISFKGKIGKKGAFPQGAVVVVYYMASWSHRFYGITDGMIPMLEIASIPLEADGEFPVTLPDLHLDPTRLKYEEGEGGNSGGFKFVVRDPKTWNILANLDCAIACRPWAGLNVLPSYPPVVEFTAKVEAKPKQP
jgi:hypothetical protein